MDVIAEENQEECLGKIECISSKLLSHSDVILYVAKFR